MISKINYADPGIYTLLKEDAHRMKQFPTEAEKCMWELLRKRKLGVLFRRQYIINQYIVDFVCFAKKLIIEVDGDYHYTEVQKIEDAQRTQQLENLGFTVIRFDNREVMVDSAEVERKIKAILYKINNENI
ncbi:MAG: endonuclease domain-containing protein [Paludibacteraceae bacterium]|nr:endonuclease domain-containing protein [Paludibacteraceae bacterium]